VTGRDLTGPSGTFNNLGSAIAIGDTNGDGLGEVITASPLEGVQEFRGRTTGLSATGVRQFTQDTSGVPGATEIGDYFGGALAVGDVTGDGRADAVVGVPGEDVGSTVDAGSIVLLKGSSSGLTGSGAQAFSQASAGVPGSPERADTFGGAVSILNLDGKGPLDVLVGVGNEFVSGNPPTQPSGYVNTFTGTAGGLEPAGAWSGAAFDLPDIHMQHFGWQFAPNTDWNFY
jgi:hypothetical protein